jgi:hypothetical protein
MLADLDSPLVVDACATWYDCRRFGTIIGACLSQYEIANEYLVHHCCNRILGVVHVCCWRLNLKKAHILKGVVRFAKLDKDWMICCAVASRSR